MRTNISLLLLIVLLFVAVPVQAGFVDFQCSFPDDPTQVNHNWNFTGYDSFGNPLPDDSMSGAATYDLTLSETIEKLGFDQVGMFGATDEDPIFVVIKTITNSSGVAWTSYELTLDGVATFVGTPGSTIFSSGIISDNNQKVTFSGGSVLDGGIVTLQASINVPTTGSFNFTMTQNAIPEPATIAILGLGGAALLMKRKKK